MDQLRSTQAVLTLTKEEEVGVHEGHVYDS